MPDPRIAAFARSTLLPAYSAIAASPRLRREHAAFIYDDAIDEPLHATLIAELHRDHAPLGAVLVIEDLFHRPPPFGGRYVVAPTFRFDEGALFVSPVVMFQMQFDRELHTFRQRYASLSEIAIEKVTRAMIENHALHSFSYFVRHASSAIRLW